MSTREPNVIEIPALTPQRRVVLEVIRSNMGHLTANEIFEEARRRLSTISYATVYNSLRHLKNAGLVAELNFGNGASRYDRETARHDHAICSKCGTLVDLDIPATVDLMRSAALQSDFRAESIHLTLTGVCAECRRVTDS
jgi:Fur family peroxide stress response transcriptional regulator